MVKFRQRIVSGSSEDEIEETFLHQDCLFNLLKRLSWKWKMTSPFPFRGKVRALPAATTPMKPIYGALHPLEGGRPYLYDEEAIALTVALESLNNFWEQYRKRLNSNFSKLSGTYTVYAPSLDSDVEEAIKVVVKTMPDLANELHQLVEEDDEDDDDSPLINEDLW